MIKIVGVRFRSAGKVYYFDPKDLQVRMGEHVIAETSKGLEYGVISTCTKMVDEELVQQPLRSLVRRATEEDEQKIEALRVKEKEALRVCREKVREHDLDMKMVDAEYSFDGSKVLFFFTADGRVDFRNLVKDLAGVFHVRIELRQIGVRDETRMLGGIGTCGRELCCATFLRDFQPVSIKMAKEQNLSLNPSKISGTCGRLMCCLKNEEATYEYLNARMPKMGEEAITADGQTGKVIELDVLRQRVRVLFEEGDAKEVETFPVGELTFRPRKKKDPAQQGKKTRAEKAEKPDKDQNGDAAGGQDTVKAEKSEKNPKRGEKAARPDHRDQGEKSVRSDQKDRGEKAARPDQKDRGEKTVRADRRDQGEKTARPEHRDEGDNTGKAERSEHRRPRRRKSPRTEGGAEAAPAAQAQPSGSADEKGAEDRNSYRKRRRHRPRRPEGQGQAGADA